MEEPFPMMTFKLTHLPLLAAAMLLSACASLVPPLAEAPPPAPEPAPVVATPVALPAPAPAASGPLLAESGPLAPLPPPTTGRIDTTQDGDRGDLWERVRGGFAMADIDNDLVRKWENWYARDPAYVTRMTTRGGRYLFHIVEEVQRRGLPTELALLPFIESAFNPQAQSHARAMGMWQFMPATGKDFELRQNLFRDDRRDVLASTRAALDYLERLNGLFSDWHLALAAYNWGQGNVSRAIERNRRGGKVADYESLRMPIETREYVPKLQAVKNIVLRPEAFGLSLPPLENHPFFLSVPIERDIDVALAAQLAGLDLDEFEQLNPQMNKPVILAAGTPQVLLPYDNANRFVRALQAHRGALATWTAWVAPRTLPPAEAARLIGMSEDELRQANRIPKGMLVKAGSTLLVPRDDDDGDVAEHIAHHGLLALTPEGRPMRKISFKAGRKGDSVAAVARRYRVSAAQVAQWNGVSSQARFKAGQTITVEVRAAPARRAVASNSKKPAVAAATKGPRKPTRAAKAAPAAKSSKAATKTAAKNVANRAGTAAAGPRKPPVASAKHPAR
jgi:membrane-bound lytic murein transglycosylase D